MSNTDNLVARIEVLRKVGKSGEADQIERRLSELLAEANKIPTNLIIEIDTGPLFSRDFTKDGFHMEKPRQAGKTKFEVKPVIGDDESPIGGDEMLKRAREVGCTTSQEEGDRIAASLNSSAGKEASKALKDSGCRYLILPNEKDFWVNDSGVNRYVPVLSLDGEQWVSDLYCLDSGYFGSSVRFLVPCKP